MAGAVEVTIIAEFCGERRMFTIAITINQDSLELLKAEIKSNLGCKDDLSIFCKDENSLTPVPRSRPHSFSFAIDFS